MIAVGLILIIIGIVGMNRQAHSAQETTLISNSDIVYSGNQTQKENLLTNSEKGKLFEDYIANCFNDSDKFNLIRENQSTMSNDTIATTSNRNPDFKITQRFSDDFYVTYWVECTYRTKPSNVEVELKDYQLQRYRRVQRDTHFKVMLAIGTGGTPNVPDEVFVIPLDSVNNNIILLEPLQSFRLSNPTTDFSNYMKSYFSNHVFKKKK